MTEADLYEQLAQYLNLKHPSLLYRFDQGGMWTSSHKARNLYGRLNRRAFPDLFIYKTEFGDGTINVRAGLALELKRQGTKLKTKAGRWVNEHVSEQAEVLDELREQGYYAEFAVGFDDAVEYIESYLSGGLNPDERQLEAHGIPF
jgi:hypothetical protein